MKCYCRLQMYLWYQIQLCYLFGFGKQEILFLLTSGMPSFSFNPEIQWNSSTEVLEHDRFAIWPS
jgi:hypothetical protein